MLWLRLPCLPAQPTPVASYWTINKIQGQESACKALVIQLLATLLHPSFLPRPLISSHAYFSLCSSLPLPDTLSAYPSFPITTNLPVHLQNSKIVPSSSFKVFLLNLSLCLWSSTGPHACYKSVLPFGYNLSPDAISGFVSSSRYEALLFLNLLTSFPYQHNAFIKYLGILYSVPRSHSLPLPPRSTVLPLLPSQKKNKYQVRFVLPMDSLEHGHLSLSFPLGYVVNTGRKRISLELLY